MAIAGVMAVTLLVVVDWNVDLDVAGEDDDGVLGVAGVLEGDVDHFWAPIVGICGVPATNGR